MQLPAAIRDYFEADQHLAGVGPLPAFAADAVVRDEGRTHTGHDAIGAWRRAAKAHYQHTAEPREVDEKDGLTIVRAEVAGRFSGSPALLTFSFQLAYGRIAAL